MASNAQPSTQAHAAGSEGLIRFAGLACIIGGLLWSVLVAIDQSEASIPDYVSGLLIPIPMLIGMACGPLGLLALRADRSGGMRRTGIVGASITLLGILAYLAAALSPYFAGEEVEIFYPAGALLAGIGMVTLGIAAFAGRWLPGWRRAAPLCVGLYYVGMIPFQIVFFIIPDGEPSPILLGIWSVAWILFGYALRSGSRSRHA